MTWAEFNTEVRVYLSVHNRRQGIQPLIDKWIRAGAIDLQRIVEYFQQGHLDLLAPTDLTENGFAHVGTMPDGEVRRFRILTADTDGNADTCVDHILEQISWNLVQAMVCGRVDPHSKRVALDRRARVFYFVPKLDTDQFLEIAWVGVKSDFDDADPVLFDEKSAQAVGEYVLTRVSRLIDNDLEMAASYDRSYRQLRKELYLYFRYRQFVLDGFAYDLTASAASRNSIPLADNDGTLVADNDGSIVIDNP